MTVGYVISFDIGGTYVRGELRRGRRALKRLAVRTPKRLDKLEALFKSFINKLEPSRGKVRQVDIGVAGLVKGTSAITCRNIPRLKNFNFRKVVPRNYKLTVDNDARAFLRRQLALGAAHGAKRVLGLTIGTGIGRAYAEHGKVKRIKAFEHAEPWEKQYQRLRFRHSSYLAKFLAKKFTPLIKKYQPDTIVVGGGVTSRKAGLVRQLKLALAYFPLALAR